MIVFETEPSIDEFGETIIEIPEKILRSNNGLYEEDGNTRWRIRVTIEKI